MKQKVKNIVDILKDRITGKAPKGIKRSSKWHKVRAKHLVENLECALCGDSKQLNVHHLVSFHMASDLELDSNNLITLCENKKMASIAINALDILETIDI